MAFLHLSGQFVGTGQSKAVLVRGQFNLTLFGSFTATVKIERSFNDGSSWHVVARDGSGNEAAYSSTVSLIGEEPEEGVLYRLNCTAFTSGPVQYRLSQ